MTLRGISRECPETAAVLTKFCTPGIFSPMKHEPRPFQRAGIDHAVEQLKAGVPYTLYSAPTGVGKSVVEIAVQEVMGRSECSMISPREEIIDGVLDKIGAPVGASPSDYNVWTPIMYRNRLMSGSVHHPKWVIFDETHHHEASSWQDLSLLTGCCPSVGYTASPYRGTPRGTASFRKTWGEPIPLITYPEAFEAGYISMPEMRILPLVDDDEVLVSGSDFEVRSLEAATVDRLGDLAEQARQWYSDGRWDMATVFGLPSGDMCLRMQQELAKRGMPAAIVSCRYARGERPEIFEACEAGILAILHVDVISEGVDRHFRRYVDAAPTMSPVKWVQRIGRIMRHWNHTPQYVCTNRNVLRHAYVLEGCVPTSVVREADAVFKPTMRGHSRVLGMEALGRFKPSFVLTSEDIKVHIYALSCLIQNVAVEFCCLLHPTRDPIWARKLNTRSETGERVWGKWEACEEPTELRGFSSASPKEPSEKQRGWWNRSARHFGLKTDQELTKKSFAALPVLCDLGEHL